MNKYYNKPCFYDGPNHPRECKVDGYCPLLDKWLHCDYGGNSPYLDGYRNQEEAEAYGEYTAKPRYKKIRIKTKWLPDEGKYVVLEVDALTMGELPTDYIYYGKTTLVFKNDDGHLYVRSEACYVYYVVPGEKYTKGIMEKIKAICDQAGKRLHEINKKRREAEKLKVETWEW